METVGEGLGEGASRRRALRRQNAVDLDLSGSASSLHRLTDTSFHVAAVETCSASGKSEYRNVKICPPRKEAVEIV